MRIGISVITQQDQSVWNNSLMQAAVFLAYSLRCGPNVKSLVLIDLGDQGVLPAGIHPLLPAIPVLTPALAADHVDVVIEMAPGLDVPWLDYLRARGKKVIGYVAEQPFCEWVEPTVFERPGYAARPDRYDAIWVPLQYRAFTQMLRALHRCPTEEVPFLWSPVFLEQRIADIYHQGSQFGYVARPADEKGHRAGLRPVIAEPNRSVSRSFTIPLLACDEAYRAEPRSIEATQLLNCLQMKEHATMLHLLHSLNLFRDRKAVLLGSHDIVGILAQQANALVSHQWMNPQHYADLEALYGNYPLIHNASWMRDLGYYYPAFDCQEAAKQLLQAHHQHDQQLAVQAEKVCQLVKDLDPFAPANVQRHCDLLLALVKDLA